MAPKSSRTLVAKRCLEVLPAATASAKKSKIETVAVAEPVKKSKVETVDPALQAVLDALRSTDVPEHCRAMLISIAPSLDMLAASRQELPTMFVNMIGEALDGRRVVLEQAIADEKAKLADVEQSRTGREAKVTEAETALADRTAEVNDRMEVVETSSKAATDAKKAVAEAMKQLHEFDVSVSGASEEKTMIETALSERFLPLRQGCEPGEAKAHAEVLVPLASRIKLDESLVVALPGFCTKQPSERGAFDEMIIEQLEEQMRQKVSALVQFLTDSEAAKAEHVAAVEVARCGAGQAAEQQSTAAASLEAAKASQLQASIALEDARAHVLAFEPEHRQAANALKEKEAALHSFVSVNLASYEMLRNKPTVTTMDEQVVDTQLKAAAGSP